LRFNERKVLSETGKRSRTDANVIAAEEFEKFAQRCCKEKENHGALENIRALETVAKQLESSKPKLPRKNKGE